MSHPPALQPRSGRSPPGSTPSASGALAKLLERHLLDHAKNSIILRLLQNPDHGSIASQPAEGGLLSSTPGSTPSAPGALLRVPETRDCEIQLWCVKWRPPATWRHSLASVVLLCTQGLREPGATICSLGYGGWDASPPALVCSPGFRKLGGRGQAEDPSYPGFKARYCVSWSCYWPPGSTPFASHPYLQMPLQAKTA